MLDFTQFYRLSICSVGFRALIAFLVLRKEDCINQICMCTLVVHLNDDSHVHFGCSPTITVPILDLATKKSFLDLYAMYAFVLF